MMLTDMNKNTAVYIFFITYGAWNYPTYAVVGGAGTT